ncbi:GNAT family acetyltransferase [Actinoplanes italicus]|uniref:Putative acetyltransferase n=1 Tax=Actinoplanes italicus TaxID=113567 RepID=A0A2T0JRE1_9ACTN|nr:GNAT family N-acetyltransferase [Actinoplanes italicus]PRX10201.1 putative acetyltransferase [Actinoplanes italicus]GIE34876.1 GNAT family acetyltransferase [Actinoplanes italicus]
MTARIRAFAGSDAEGVAELVAVCLRTVNSRDYPTETIERMCAYFVPDRFLRLAAQRQIFVAESDGEVIGTVSREGNKVFTMFVHPGHHGQGIGRRLMRHIEALAASDGFDHMETGASITAHDFYHRLGYVDVRTSETEFGLNYILRRRLAPGMAP